MKKLIFFILALLIISSCKNSEKGLKVGFLIPNEAIDRNKKEKIYFSDKIAQLGGEAIVVSADDDDKMQIKQAHDLLEQGVKVLVVNSVNQVTAAAIVRDAHDYNVKVIAYDRMISNCDLDYYLSFDNKKVGKLMAEYALKLKPNGNYLIFGGDKADQNAIYVKSGQLETIDPYVKKGDIKILFNIYIEDWAGDNAKYYFEKFFNLSDIKPDVVLASYDGFATNIIEVLKEKNIPAGDIVLTGQDAELASCRNIINGYQSMTVYKPLKVLAEQAAEICKKIVDNDKIEKATAVQSNGFKDVPAILLDPISVDKSNLKSTVIADGMYKESDLYQ